MRSFYSAVANHTLGVGLGLRAPHVAQILKQRPELDWFELLADNHIVSGGWARQQAIEIAQLYPLTMHCVGMSIGSTDPINFDYLARVKSLATTIKPKMISDHLCWTSWHSQHSHDLLPLPYTEEALAHVVNRITQIQDFLKTHIAIENVSSYLTFKHSTIDEVEFVNAVAKQADCNILFDINNLYVNHVNNDQDMHAYINAIDISRVVELHMAGFDEKENYVLDAHNSKVHKNVWKLYEIFLQRKNDIPTLIEWDHEIPTFDVLYAETIKARAIQEQCLLKKENTYAVA